MTHKTTQQIMFKINWIECISNDFRMNPICNGHYEVLTEVCVNIAVFWDVTLVPPKNFYAYRFTRLHDVTSKKAVSLFNISLREPG
jgi:hypothetical protein